LEDEGNLGAAFPVSAAPSFLAEARSANASNTSSSASLSAEDMINKNKYGAPPGFLKLERSFLFFRTFRRRKLL
jgi:hypothetical protein